MAPTDYFSHPYFHPYEHLLVGFLNDPKTRTGEGLSRMNLARVFSLYE